MVDRIDYDAEDGELDDLNLENVRVHIERMTKKGYVIVVDAGDHVVHLNARRVRVESTWPGDAPSGEGPTDV